MITDTRKSPGAKVSSISYENVEWTGGVLKERFDTCANVTVSHLQHMFESKISAMSWRILRLQQERQRATLTERYLVMAIFILFSAENLV